MASDGESLSACMSATISAGVSYIVILPASMSSIISDWLLYCSLDFRTNPCGWQGISVG